jgi:hypothetical protein
MRMLKKIGLILAAGAAVKTPLIAVYGDESAPTEAPAALLPVFMRAPVELQAAA